MKKGIVIFLCVLLVLVASLSGCTGTKDINNNNAANEASSISSNEGSNNEDKTSSGEEQGVEEYTLPIVQPGTFTLKVAAADSGYSAVTLADNLPIWEEFEKRTGVKVEWQVSPGNDYSTAIQTRIAAGQDLPDIMQLPSRDEVTKLADDEIIIPMDDLINRYAPNILKIFEEEPDFKRAFTAPDGHIYYINHIMGSNELNPWIPLIRNDWLKKLGLKEPETVDDWYNVLKAFKEQDPNGNGEADEIPLSGYANFPSSYGPWGYAYGLHLFHSSGWSAGEDGKVKYEWMEPELKEFLEFLNKLYKEGLMDPMIYQPNLGALEALISKDLVGSAAAGTNPIVKWDNIQKGVGIDDVDWVSVVPPKKDSDGKRIVERRPVYDRMHSITTACKEPEIAIKWMDYVWGSEEGRLLQNFGIEGETFVMEGGKPKYTDVIVNNPEGLAPLPSLRSYGAHNLLGIESKEAYLQQLLVDKQKDHGLKCEPYLVDHFPLVIPTAEESARIKSVMGDIDTYREEMINKFVIGTESLDNFDNFVSQLKAMGIEEIIQIKQAQYDRYMGK